jgi:hypothetical protein
MANFIYALFAISIILGLRLIYEILPEENIIKDFYMDTFIKCLNFFTICIGYIFTGKITLIIMLDDIPQDKTKKQIKSHIKDTANHCLSEIIVNTSTPEEFKVILQEMNAKAKKITLQKYHEIRINRVVKDFFAE